MEPVTKSLVLQDIDVQIKDHPEEINLDGTKIGTFSAKLKEKLGNLSMNSPHTRRKVQEPRESRPQRMRNYLFR